jgi:hypothetical protein
MPFDAPEEALAASQRPQGFLFGRHKLVVFCIGAVLSFTEPRGAVNGHAVQEPLAVDLVGLKGAQFVSIHVLAVLNGRN